MRASWLLVLAAPCLAAPQYATQPLAYDDLSTYPVYAFKYGVSDEVTGTEFGQEEARDGEQITGSYSVALPDGRIQTVTYRDDGDGVAAEVSYTGVARYDAAVPAAIFGHPSAHAAPLAPVLRHVSPVVHTAPLVRTHAAPVVSAPVFRQAASVAHLAPTVVASHPRVVASHPPVLASHPPVVASHPPVVTSHPAVHLPTFHRYTAGQGRRVLAEPAVQEAKMEEAEVEEKEVIEAVELRSGKNIAVEDEEKDTSNRMATMVAQQVAQMRRDQKDKVEEAKKATQATEAKEAKEAQEAQDAKEAQKAQEAQDAKDAEEAQEAQETQEAQKAQNAKEAREAQEAKEAQEAMKEVEMAAQIEKEQQKENTEKAEVKSTNAPEKDQSANETIRKIKLQVKKRVDEGEKRAREEFKNTEQITAQKRRQAKAEEENEDKSKYESPVSKADESKEEAKKEVEVSEPTYYRLYRRVY